jgi:serine/threonine protein kinase
MGDVYLGRWNRGELVAVKLLREDLTFDAQFRARFRREVQVALRVRGLCTAKLVDADLETERPWLATEFVDGPTLREFVHEHGPLSQPELVP